MTDPDSTARPQSDDRQRTPNGGAACNGLYLRTLGGLALVDASGEPLVPPGHTRKLILLAVLALADAPVSRDELTAMFWGDDSDRRSARHSLSNTLSFLRGFVGRNAITMHRAEILLAPGVLDVDAVTLLSAARARNAAGVMRLYRGAFMGDIAPTGSPALDGWIEKTRAGITRAMIVAAEVRCAAAARAQDWEACAANARMWLEAAPTTPEADGQWRSVCRLRARRVAQR